MKDLIAKRNSKGLAKKAPAKKAVAKKAPAKKKAAAKRPAAKKKTVAYAIKEISPKNLTSSGT